MKLTVKKGFSILGIFPPFSFTSGLDVLTLGGTI
jgi:hypothetical protein